MSRPLVLASLAVVAAGVLAVGARAHAGHPSGWALQTIEADRLKTVLDRGQRVVIVDVRSPDEFKQGHIPGARSLSLDESGDRFRELPRREPVVLYCACPISEIGPAYQFMRYSGFTNVFVLHGGLAEWLARGYALEK
jgi:rhodanese-related sulfurtransferase